jgi:hypothetical protein
MVTLPRFSAGTTPCHYNALRVMWEVILSKECVYKDGPFPTIAELWQFKSAQRKMNESIYQMNLLLHFMRYI